ncbi:hypothetical protein ANO14919_085350 [Xylariales sp. No.14919]|nr:hypothetical protein ANO14919_085350 [Xylariales sp. No.14919]
MCASSRSFLSTTRSPALWKSSSPYLVCYNSSCSSLTAFWPCTHHSTAIEPGGYLQWGEPDLESLRFDTTKPEAKTDNLRELFSLLSVQDPRLKPTRINHLDKIFTNSGFVEVERVTRDAPPHLAFMFHEAGLMIHEQIARKTKNEYMAGELNRLLPAAVEETRLGAYVT